MINISYRNCTTLRSSLYIRRFNKNLCLRFLKAAGWWSMAFVDLSWSMYYCVEWPEERILYDTLKLQGERNNTESCLNGYQSKSVRGWCLWEIWLVDGAAPSLNKHMAAFHVMFGTPILTATQKSKVTSKCFFHPFSSTLLILKLASTAMGTAFLMSLICAVLYFMPQILHFDLTGPLIFLGVTTIISSPQTRNLMNFKFLKLSLDLNLKRCMLHCIYYLYSALFMCPFFKVQERAQWLLQVKGVVSADQCRRGNGVSDWAEMTWSVWHDWECQRFHTCSFSESICWFFGCFFWPTVWVLFDVSRNH